MPAFTQVTASHLHPHPRNISIYGDEDVTQLVELISQSGWVKALVCTSHNVIISGHRRWKAVQILGWKTVSVEYREFPDETAELEALLLENASRTKSAEQKVREGFAWSDVEKEKAKERQRIAARETNQRLSRDADQTLPENFPEASKGEARNYIASRIGLGSGRTYEKAAKVVSYSDESASLGHLEIAQVLRKTLNEQSVDAAHALLKKTPQELRAIANLITSGKAKSTRAAAKMINQNNSEGSNSTNSSDPSQPSLAGFSVGDWIEINESANEHNNTYIGQRGRIEQVLAVENEISVSLEGVTDKIRFKPRELCLLLEAPPANPVHAGDLVFIHINSQEAVSPQEKRWNGFWGKVSQVGEMGSLSVDVGKESLQLFPRDVKPVDSPSSELRQVVERVLRLRRLALDEVEEGMLNMFQRREWFTPRQLDYLDVMEKLLFADLHKSNEHQVVQFKGR